MGEREREQQGRKGRPYTALSNEKLLSHFAATNRQISGKYCRPQIASNFMLPSYLSPACSSRSSSTGHKAAGREDVASGREQAAGELSRHLAETNSMTSLNINTRLVIALGIVIDFS